MTTALSGAIQKSLTARMRDTFSSQEMKVLAKTIATMQGSGVKVDDVFPIGIVVQPDGVSIRGHMNLSGNLLYFINYFNRRAPPRR